MSAKKGGNSYKSLWTARPTKGYDNFEIPLGYGGGQQPDVFLPPCKGHVSFVTVSVLLGFG